MKAKILNKIFTNRKHLEESYTIIKWDLSQGLKDGSMSTNQLIWYTTLTLWPLDVKSWLIWKDPDAGKDWKQEEKEMADDEMVGCINGPEFEQPLGVGDEDDCLVCCSSWGHRVGHNWATELSWVLINPGSLLHLYFEHFYVCQTVSVCLTRPWALWRQRVYHFLKLFFACVYSYQLEKAMAPHSSTLAWKIPWIE